MDVKEGIQQIDQSNITKQREHIIRLEKDLDRAILQGKSKNEKIMQHEEQIRSLKEQLKGYNDMKRQQENLMKQLDKMSAENLKLSMQKKEMSMNFNKEVQANKVQQTMALKIQNERHLNAETKIQVTFYDSLSGLDAQTLELVNEKIEEVRQQAQQKLAYMVQDIERKND